MNAYIASFMLLLFNAVGLAAPASAAAQERMMPVGSAANLSEASVVDPCAVVEPARAGLSDFQSCAMAEIWLSVPLAIVKSDNKQQAWAVVAMRSEAGDKLEHEEGAP